MPVCAEHSPQNRQNPQHEQCQPEHRIPSPKRHAPSDHNDTANTPAVTQRSHPASLRGSACRVYGSSRDTRRNHFGLPCRTIAAHRVRAQGPTCHPEMMREMTGASRPAFARRRAAYRATRDGRRRRPSLRRKPEAEALETGSASSGARDGLGAGGARDGQSEEGRSGHAQRRAALTTGLATAAPRDAPPRARVPPPIDAASAAGVPRPPATA